jgi:hypothetical protein
MDADAGENVTDESNFVQPRWEIHPRIVGTLELTPQHLEAADLLAEGSLPIAEIAERVGVTRWTLWAWRERSEFCRLVAQRREYYESAAFSHGVALRHERVRTYTHIWDGLQRIVAERAASAPDDVPGAKSGLMVRRKRSIGEGDRAQVVEDWTTDAALVRSIQRIGELAAKELGQWLPQGEIDGAREVHAEVTTSTTAELLQRARQILIAAGELPPEVPAGDP